MRDKINQWVEDTLFYVIMKKRSDGIHADSNLLYLFRLLAIKYRTVYPVGGEPFSIDEDLLVVLESKICNAAMHYFGDVKLNYNEKKQRLPNRHHILQPVGRFPDNNEPFEKHRRGEKDLRPDPKRKFRF